MTNRINSTTVIFFIFTMVLFAIAISNHYFFRTYGMDYGSYIQALFKFAHFEMTDQPAVAREIPPGTFFAKHFTLTLIWFVPFYWVFNWIFGTYLLLILQVVFILLGAWGLFRFIFEISGKRWFANMALLHYFLLHGRYTAFNLDYTDTTVAATLVPLLIYLIYKRKLVWSTVVFLFILTSKENMAVWLSCIFITLAILFWKQSRIRNYSFILSVLSIIYFGTVMSVISSVSATETGNYQYDGFTYSILLGHTPLEAVKTLFSNPMKYIEYLFMTHLDDPAFKNVKVEFYFVYLLSGGLILLFRPVFILMFLPILAQKMWNDNPVIWSIEQHYPIEFVSVLSVIAFWILFEVFKNHHKRIKLITGVLVVTTCIITIYKMDRVNRQIAWWGTVKEKFYDDDMYKANFDAKKVHIAIRTILPEDAKVVANSFLLPHLAQRDFIYHFPYIRDAEYIAILGDKAWPLTPEQFNNKVAELKNSQDFEIIYEENTLLILKRRQYEE